MADCLALPEAFHAIDHMRLSKIAAALILMPSINQSLFFTIVKQENEQAMNLSFSNYTTYEN